MSKCQHCAKAYAEKWPRTRERLIADLERMRDQRDALKDELKDAYRTTHCVTEMRNEAWRRQDAALAEVGEFRAKLKAAEAGRDALVEILAQR